MDMGLEMEVVSIPHHHSSSRRVAVAWGMSTRIGIIQRVLSDGWQRKYV